MPFEDQHDPGGGLISFLACMVLMAMAACLGYACVQFVLWVIR